MPVVIRYSGQVVTAHDLRGTVVARSPDWKATVVSGMLGGGIPFDGPYEVTPDADGETLATRMKTMADDVTINPIPYVETTNEAGGYTISIAS